MFYSSAGMPSIPHGVNTVNEVRVEGHELIDIHRAYLDRIASALNPALAQVRLEWNRARYDGGIGKRSTERAKNLLREWFKAAEEAAEPVREQLQKLLFEYESSLSIKLQQCKGFWKPCTESNEIKELLREYNDNHRGQASNTNRVESRHESLTNLSEPTQPNMDHGIAVDIPALFTSPDASLEEHSSSVSDQSINEQRTRVEGEVLSSSRAESQCIRELSSNRGGGASETLSNYREAQIHAIHPRTYQLVDLIRPQSASCGPPRRDIWQGLVVPTHEEPPRFLLEPDRGLADFLRQIAEQQYPSFRPLASATLSVENILLPLRMELQRIEAHSMRHLLPLSISSDSFLRPLAFTENSLSKSITDLGFHDKAQKWAEYEAERWAKSFSAWLENLNSTEDGRNNQAMLKEHLGKLLDAMEKDSELRAHCFARVEEFTSTCHDNITWGLFELTVDARDRETELADLTYDELVRRGRDMYAVSLIKQSAQAKGNEIRNTTTFNEDLEIALYYAIELKDILPLDIPVHGMRYAMSVAQHIQDTDIAMLRTTITGIRNGSELTDEILNFMLTWPALQRKLDLRKAAARKEIEDDAQRRIALLDADLDIKDLPKVDAYQSISDVRQTALQELDLRATKAYLDELRARGVNPV
ncbi:MAG: SspH1 [Noviherbaspirillum sp.]|nr:SspH1 [Noviherbaspirillum sp.]